VSKHQAGLGPTRTRTAFSNRVRLCCTPFLLTQPHGSRSGLSIGGSGVCCILFILSAYATLEFNFPVPTKGTLDVSGWQRIFALLPYRSLNRDFHFLQFDGGGFRWPFIFDMCITTLYVGSLLLSVQMALKQAAGPALAAVLVMVPLFMFQKEMKTRFLRSFEDAALLQTALLDGWDNSHDYAFEKREEFRAFLVDAHKAAYVRTSCIEVL